MLKGFFNNDFSLKVISLLIAFAAWFIVVENVDRESYATFRDVPIDMTNVEDSISTLGLNSITPDVEYATVNVSGVMYAVGNMTKDNITIVPDVSKVTGAGVYELPLIGSITDDNGAPKFSAAMIVLGFGEMMFPHLPPPTIASSIPNLGIFNLSAMIMATGATVITATSIKTPTAVSNIVERANAK